MSTFSNRLLLLTRTVTSHDWSALRLVATATVLFVGSTAAYTVTSGDTLSEIAIRAGISTSALAEANGLDDPNLIRVGQVLQIPGDAQTGIGEPSSTGPGGTHVVQRGESLSTIAARYGMSAAELAAANGIENPNLVRAGSTLRLDSSPPPTPGTPGGGASGTHTVAPGETLSTIAAHYGVTMTDLIEANGISDPSLIYAGQSLSVPGGGGTAWVCPVPGASYVNDFGYVKPDGRTHEGIDMFAENESVILAPVGGTLRQVEGARAGLQFTLEGDDGITYIGTHLAAWGRSGRVEQGDEIGLVGTTGNARGTSPHLHFEMHHDGVMSPYPTLTQYCG